jgi:hypothetical protein
MNRLSSIGTLATLLLLGCKQTEPEFDVPAQQEPEHAYNWGFLSDVSLDLGHPREAIQTSVPIGEKLDRQLSLEERRGLTAGVVQRVIDQTGKTDLTLSAYLQYALQPGEPHLMESHRRYIDACRIHMKQRLGIDASGIELVIVKQGDDYREGGANKAFIGRRRYEVSFARMDDNESSWFNEYPFSAKAKSGAYILDNKNDGFHVVFSAGASVLQSPFSEFLVLGVRDSYWEHVPRYADDIERLRMIGEALTESAALILGEEMVDALDVPNGREFLVTAHTRMLAEEPVIYAQVPQAIAWLRKDSSHLQRGFELYRQDPELYLAAILE